MDFDVNLGSFVQQMEKRIGAGPMKALFWVAWSVIIYAAISVVPMIFQAAWKPLMEGLWGDYSWSEAAWKGAGRLGLFFLSVGLAIGITELAWRYFYSPRLEKQLAKGREELKSGAEALEAQAESTKSELLRQARVADNRIRIANEVQTETIQMLETTKAQRKQVASMLAKLERKLGEVNDV